MDDKNEMNSVRPSLTSMSFNLAAGGMTGNGTVMIPPV